MKYFEELDKLEESVLKVRLLIGLLEKTHNAKAVSEIDVDDMLYLLDDYAQSVSAELHKAFFALYEACRRDGELV